jgi:hypothetical protein
MMLTGEQMYPSIISSIVNFIWTKPELNPGLCGDKPDTNLLTRGTDAVFITCPYPPLCRSKMEDGFISLQDVFS